MTDLLILLLVGLAVAGVLKHTVAFLAWAFAGFWLVLLVASLAMGAGHPSSGFLVSMILAPWSLSHIWSRARRGHWRSWVLNRLELSVAAYRASR